MGSSGFLRSTADKITSTEHEQKRPEKQVNLAGVKVLLAEDNELNSEIAKVLLEDEKMIVTEVCNDCQFEFASGSDFVNFMNLKPTSRPVTVRPKENLRVCYMVFSVSQAIRPRERGRLWAEGFLKHCGISKSYYDKHRSDVCGKGATEENRNCRKAIDKAIENARRLNNTP